MIFLHGKGDEPHHPKHDIINEIAKARGAELIHINATRPHRSGNKWFNSSSKFEETDKETIEQFNHSVEQILAEVDKLAEARDISYDDIIFCGRSQGAFMSLHIGLTYGAKEIISIFGYFPTNLQYNIDIKKDIPILWLEAENEEVINAERRASYKILQSLGCNLTYKIAPKSSHDYIDPTILDLI